MAVAIAAAMAAVAMEEVAAAVVTSRETANHEIVLTPLPQRF
jgi:hypothetical protein